MVKDFIQILGSMLIFRYQTGIRVHTNKPPFLMHHKFFIIDDELLCSGSFNWTSQAVTGNNESVIITNDPWTVEPFCAEFQKLWQETKPGN
jgi:cardiolipin hydrolase